MKHLSTTLPLLLMGLLSVAALTSCDWYGEDREVTTASDDAYLAYKNGTAELGRFRLQSALDNFGKAIELDPEFAMAHAELAIVQRRLGQKEESQASIQRAVAASGNVTEIEQLWINRMFAAFNGDEETADAAYAELLSKYPDRKWTLHLRAEKAKQVNDNDEALACYNKILALDPEAVSVHNLKGYLYLSMGEYDKAVESLQRYAFYAPEQANPHDSLGEAFLYTGRFDESITEFVTALEIDPTFVWSGIHLAQALSITGQTKKAHSVLAQVKPVFEERGWIQWWEMESSKVDFRAESWEAVLARVSKSLQGMQDSDMASEFSLWSQYARTICLLELGELAEAEAMIDTLEKAVESFSEEHKGTVRIAEMLGLNRAYVISRFGRAGGQPELGIEGLKTALAGASLSPHELSIFRYELAEAQLESNQAEAAVATAGILLDTIPTAPDMNLVAARAHDALNNPERALAHLEIYMDVMRNADDGHPKVQRAKALLKRLVPRS